MEEELQSLLARIQSEGIDKAQVEAADIVAAAEDKARAIVNAAEQRAADLMTTAERDSLLFQERSRQALDQVGRDFLIGVRNDLDEVLSAGVREVVGEALTPETMAEMIVKMAEAYGAKDLRENRVEVLLSPEDQKEFARLALGSYQERLGGGIEIRAVKGISHGFRISFSDGSLHHDFTQDALAASLSQLLKPPLNDIVAAAGSSATAEQADSEGK